MRQPHTARELHIGAAPEFDSDSRRCASSRLLRRVGIVRRIDLKHDDVGSRDPGGAAPGRAFRFGEPKPLHLKPGCAAVGRRQLRRCAKGGFVLVLDATWPSGRRISPLPGIIIAGGPTSTRVDNNDRAEPIEMTDDANVGRILGVPRHPRR